MLVQMEAATMFSLYGVKPGFQALLRPLVGRLAAVGVTANEVTVFAGVTSVALGAGIAWQHGGWILLPPFLLFRMALNAVDGMLAREHGQQSRLGAMLNELSDVVSDAALTIPLATMPEWNPVAVAGAVFLALLTEFVGVAAVVIGSPRRYEGPFGKSDRALALAVIAAWLAFGLPVKPEAAVAVLGLWMVLCCVTVVQRVRGALG
jgi:CDP-diacylglycerol---glycerol-3-phosphate 3-phosphatidyltransferase